MATYKCDGCGKEFSQKLGHESHNNHEKHCDSTNIIISEHVTSNGNENKNENKNENENENENGNENGNEDIKKVIAYYKRKFIGVCYEICDLELQGWWNSLWSIRK